MRIGIFSDTHGNLAALQAVLHALEKEKIDTLVCLGDSVGYGPLPNECCDIIRKETQFTIIGNHDAAVAGRMDYSYYYDAARQALDHHAQTLSEDNMAWLQQLKYIERIKNLHFCHGSPVDIEQFAYIFSPEQASTCVPIWNDLGRATFIGHSHLCKSFAITPERVHEIVTHEFPLREGFRYIISVGSVGQPRDRDPRAGYTIYDSGQEYFQFKRVDYDIQSTADLIYSNENLSDSFAERLFSGL